MSKELQSDIKAIHNSSTGHSVSSSSSSRPFHLNEFHPLIATYDDKPGTVELYQLDITQLQKIVPLYNLKELFTEVNFTDPDHFSQNVTASAKLKHGYYPIAWVSSLIPPQTIASQNLTFTADIEVKSLAEGLVTFQSSLSNRPDGVVVRTFHRCDKEWKLPLFILEVHSSPYKNSVSQTAMDMIDQLRLLRCFDRNIIHCTGFTFPKYPQGSESNRTCVSKVTVSFESFQFIVRIFPLNISSVQKEIKTALSRALEFHADRDPQFCFLRLSDSEMDMIRDHLNVQRLVQYPTKHSILLKSDQVFWKHIPQLIERDKFHLLKECITNARHIVLHSRMISRPISLLSFPAQIPPLSRNEVSTCLTDFMSRTALALQELHGYGFAHLDVRIPNICFSKEKNLNGQYDVKLIDLDRSTFISAKGMCGYAGEMYRKSQHGWTTDKLDWKQLGLLAARIVTKYKVADEVIVSSDLVFRDQCLRELIKEGKWIEAACRNSQVLQQHQQKSLDQVVDDKIG